MIAKITTYVLFAQMLCTLPVLAAGTVEEILQRIEKLEKELAKDQVELPEAEPLPADPSESTPPALTIGGAIRTNYVYGDYKQTPTYADSGPALPGDRRGRNVGGVSLDTFRINTTFTSGNLIADVEYRWWWYLKNAGYSALSRAISRL